MQVIKVNPRDPVELTFGWVIDPDEYPNIKYRVWLGEIYLPESGSILYESSYDYYLYMAERVAEIFCEVAESHGIEYILVGNNWTKRSPYNKAFDPETIAFLYCDNIDWLIAGTLAEKRWVGLIKRIELDRLKE